MLETRCKWERDQPRLADSGQEEEKKKSAARKAARGNGRNVEDVFIPGVEK